MIYLIGCNGFIKIGVSNRPWSRLAEFQTANPYPLEMLAIGPGDYGFESELHKSFGEHRGVGEWFEDNERIRAVINFLRQTFPEYQYRPRVEVQEELPDDHIEEDDVLPTGPRTIGQLSEMPTEIWRIETSSNGNGLSTWRWRRRGSIREYHYGGTIIP